MNPVTSFFGARTWREYAYLLAALPLSIVGFAYVLLVPSLASVVLITVVGLVLVGALIVGGRGWGSAWRGLAGALLDEPIVAPPAFVRPRGFWRGLGAAMVDLTGWRALLFTLIAFPLSMFAFVVSTTFLAVAAGGITYAIWWRFLPLQTMFDGTRHRGFSINTSDWYWFADTPGRIAIVTVGGVLLALLWVVINRGLAGVFRLLSRGLLGPTASELRIARLRSQRAAAVEDADSRLRRIERDLHDGTQARLVAVAMQLGEAQDILVTGGDPALAADLLGAAHSSTKEALTELREIARGIHPPALDAGLAVALETLAARVPLPVTVHVDPALEREGALSPALRSIAYFTVAELLTNVVKHAQATAAEVLVRRLDATTVHLRVRDDGRGGAVMVAGGDEDGLRTGLSGLAERVATVDGTLTIDSPLGAGTVVDVTLPTTPAA